MQRPRHAGALCQIPATHYPQLPALLAKHGVAHKGDLAGNLYSFLPNWLQSC